MADNNVNMRNGGANPAAPAGVDDDASHQEMGQNTVDRQHAVQQLTCTPEAICAATDNTSLKNLLLVIKHDMKQLELMIRTAHASHDVVEASSDTFKLAARMQQNFAETLERSVHQRDDIVNNVLKFAQDCKYTSDEAINAVKIIESFRKRLATLEERVEHIELLRRRVTLLEQRVGRSA